MQQGTRVEKCDGSGDAIDPYWACTKISSAAGSCFGVLYAPAATVLSVGETQGMVSVWPWSLRTVRLLALEDGLESDEAVVNKTTFAKL